MLALLLASQATPLHRLTRSQTPESLGRNSATRRPGFRFGARAAVTDSLLFQKFASPKQERRSGGGARASEPGAHGQGLTNPLGGRLASTTEVSI
jgi:hypothetical protein